MQAVRGAPESLLPSKTVTNIEKNTAHKTYNFDIRSLHHTYYNRTIYSLYTIIITTIIVYVKWTITVFYVLQRLWQVYSLLW